MLRYCSRYVYYCPQLCRDGDVDTLVWKLSSQQNIKDEDAVKYAINYPDHDGHCALHYACRFNYTARMLLSKVFCLAILKENTLPAGTTGWRSSSCSSCAARTSTRGPRSVGWLRCTSAPCEWSYSDLMPFQIFSTV